MHSDVADTSDRIRAAAANRPFPARPKNAFTRAIATGTAIFREISYLQYSPGKKAFGSKLPPLGTALLLLAYLAFVLALEFNQNDIPGAQHYTALGVRAAWLAVAQIPLLILLAGKKNIIGFITGVSFERLNVLHRWVSRVLLLLVTLHFGYQNYGWNQYGLLRMEWSTDTCPPTGIAAYAILLWLNLSTLAPIRHFSYEFFVVQHIISFFGFIVAVMLHLPSTALYSRVYIYIPIALYLLDRLVRTSLFAYNNIGPAQATMTVLEGGVTKIRVQNKRIKKWTPGSYVLLSIPRFGPGQSHPATIASIPSSHGGDLVFILKGHGGFTKRIMHSAKSYSAILLPQTEQESAKIPKHHIALIDGPYGASHADFAAFDTVLLISGSTGITFTLPLLLDIAHRASSQKLPIRRLEFIWIVKNTSWTSWVSEELQSAAEKLRDAGVEVVVKIYVTCDDAFTDSTDQVKECGCECDKSLGPCCCTTVDDIEDEDAITSIHNEGTVTNPSDLKDPEKSMPRNLASSSAKTSIYSTTKKPTRRTVPCATFNSGRPSFYSSLWEFLDQAEGESGIAVCGPFGLNATVRNTVAGISDERAVHKGTGAQGIYLHTEGFCW